MAQWLRLMLAGGEFEGQRLVSDSGFQALVSPQNPVFSQYGLGWFISDRNGHKVVSHGGNASGFESQVFIVPDQRLGFVLLTNVFASSLRGAVTEAIWANLVDHAHGGATDSIGTDPDEAIRREAGSYVSNSISMEVRYNNSQLTATMEGKGEIVLLPLGDRRYRLAASTLTNSFVTFRPVRGNDSRIEALFEQSGNSLVLSRRVGIGSASYIVPHCAFNVLPPPYGEMIQIENGNGVTQIPVNAFDINRNEFEWPDLLGSFSRLLLTRDSTGKVVGCSVRGPTSVAGLTTEQVMDKVIAAIGGTLNVSELRSYVITSDLSVENLGVMAEETTSAAGFDLFAQVRRYYVFGKTSHVDKYELMDKKLIAVADSFDQPNSVEVEDFYIPIFDEIKWKSAFKTVNLVGRTGAHKWAPAH
jgi:hypothetical protein